jgi:hypothetical protein
MAKKGRYIGGYISLSAAFNLSTAQIPEVTISLPETGNIRHA